MRFTKLTPLERLEIIRRARRMAAFTHCTLSDVAHRIAAHTGRSPETVRYTIRRHDIRHPSQAIFPHLTPPIDADQKEVIYRCFLRGVPVPALARSYNRTRGSIYRVVNEMRARQLLQRPIAMIYNPQFDLPVADSLILDAAPPHVAPPSAEAPRSQAAAPHIPDDLPPYLQSLYEVPLLTAAQEQELFRRYNYLKYKADRLRGGLDLNRIHTSRLKQIETLASSGQRRQERDHPRQPAAGRVDRKEAPGRSVRSSSARSPTATCR